ncbi:DUF3422 domain-containing protein [Methylocystis sp. SB2]|uniref:DUF3422 family protein n=1 Tax=Methylocystis sp. (strain SB2) TaxID=743836 RepID=UPI00041A33DE|nr:DUF3422 domain-containing protein [Methylocystis sp. SB2]ULO24788.1 DUF3422 domain-containing protein [Methylocystis sp. SB2]
MEISEDEPKTLREHPFREAVLAELHARPFLPLDAPRRIYHYAFATDHEAAAADREAIGALALAHGVLAPDPGARFHYFIFGDWRLRWEQHSEFTTYSWSTGVGADIPFAHADPFKAGEISFKPPGVLIVATQLCVVDGARSVEELASYFNSQSLCVVGVEDRDAQVLTDFAVDAYGFTRMLIRGKALPRFEAGRLAQRVLEIETYRTMALLGLPLARQVSPQLAIMERELSGITEALNEAHDMRVNYLLLKRLSDLLASSQALSTRTAFRFDASRAYRALVKNRLSQLQERREGQYVTISEFLSARLDPAIETCIAVEARQTRFSAQVERATDLMRTGITLEMERQNGALLEEMNRRTRLQMRLNRIVQGITIAGLAYFLTGLFSFIAKGLKAAGALPPQVSADLVAALAMPIAVLIAIAFMARVHRLSREAAEEEQLD